MRVAGLIFFVAGGSWAISWAVQNFLSRAGIFQAMGDFRTAKARAQSDVRGKRHQQRSLAFFRHGLWLAVIATIGGLIMIVVAVR